MQKTLIGLQNTVYSLAKDLMAKGYLVRIIFTNDYVKGSVATQSSPYLPLCNINICDGLIVEKVELFIEEMKTILESNYEQT